MRRFVSGLGVLLVLAAALVWWFWPTERAWLQAYAILHALEHKKIPLLCAGVALHDIKERTVSIPSANGSIPGYIYEPQGVASPRGIVLLPGVHRLGIDEPRLTEFAVALAQSGFRVLTPQLAALKDYRVSPSAVEDIRTSVAWMSAQQQAPVGVIGISFAGGLSLLADQDAATTPHIAWICSIGGHASMQRVAEYYITGKAKGPDGSVYSQTPHEYGSLILAYMHPADFLPPQDSAVLLPVLRAHLYENAPGEQALVAKLNATQQAEWRQLLAFHSQDEVARATASLAKHGAEMDAVSPEGKLGGVTTPVFLLHGAGDTVIPPTELAWLAKELPTSSVRYALVSRAITHVSIEGGEPDAIDNVKLLSFFAAVLKFAETAK